MCVSALKLKRDKAMMQQQLALPQKILKAAAHARWI